MNEATMAQCAQQWGDIPKFMTTAYVARDMDEIRKALGMDQVYAIGISYGTGIFQSEYLFGQMAVFQYN